MKLDRNINTDGRGKYALINLRTNQLQWGNEAHGEQFFVMKYKDKFTAAGLNGYADGIVKEILSLQQELAHINNVDILPRFEKEIESLREYETEIRKQAQMASDLGDRIPD